MGLENLFFWHIFSACSKLEHTTVSISPYFLILCFKAFLFELSKTMLNLPSKVTGFSLNNFEYFRIDLKVLFPIIHALIPFFPFELSDDEGD